MSEIFKRRLPLLAVGVLFAAAAVAFLLRPPSQEPVPAPSPPPPVLPLGANSLSQSPDWSALEPYQETISRDEFEALLQNVFTTGQTWRKEIEIGETEARIRTGEAPPRDFHILRFAKASEQPSIPRYWRKPEELPVAPEGKPLAGLHLAIDPGHIGGSWAKMEERWFVLNGGNPVTEGDMTLHVARLLKPRLEALGARVSLVRDRTEPVTNIRPESLKSLAGDPEPPQTPESLQKLAERLFYRTAEIHARAKVVNETLKPDLVLCLHFNAEAWGDPNQPTLVDRTHLHLLVNGAYNDEELALPDQRFALLQKLLQRTHEEEVRAGAAVAAAFSRTSGLPPYSYPPESPNVRQIPEQRYLWARNLLANRLYHCPVIFMEPYVMNSTIDYPRIQAGDYDGVREIGGKLLPSIFHEYTEGLTRGLLEYYQGVRRH